VEDLLTNSTLDRRYARIILLSKKWWSEEVVVLRSDGVDYVDCLFSDGLVLFFLLLLFFFFLVTIVVSSGIYAFCE
jgi:hypothetical protein